MEASTHHAQSHHLPGPYRFSIHARLFAGREIQSRTKLRGRKNLGCRAGPGRPSGRPDVPAEAPSSSADAACGGDGQRASDCLGHANGTRPPSRDDSSETATPRGGAVTSAVRCGVRGSRRRARIPPPRTPNTHTASLGASKGFGPKESGGSPGPRGMPGKECPWSRRAVASGRWAPGKGGGADTGGGRGPARPMRRATAPRHAPPAGIEPSIELPCFIGTDARHAPPAGIQEALSQGGRSRPLYSSYSLGGGWGGVGGGVAARTGLRRRCPTGTRGAHEGGAYEGAPCKGRS